jgi:hypothetical protein
MKLFSTTIVATTFTILSGCGSRPIYSTESYTFPEIGTVATRGVGDSLIRKDTGFLLPEAIDIKENSIVGKHKLPKGLYEYSAYNSTGIWFYAREEYFFLRKSDKFICIEKTYECAQIPYSMEMKISSLSANSFQQTLLYNGKIGNKITLGYREFSNNLARAAFSNNVDYDLSESTLVGYKGARLEIIKATNTEITYRVLVGFPN